MSQHTPGPWNVTHESIIPRVYGPDNNLIAEIQPQRRRDAHLIAAAPAMYEALKMARWLSNECECHESWNAPEGNLCGHCTADLAIKTALSQAEGRHHE